MYYAHSLPDDPDKARWQTLASHLLGTAMLAEGFASEFGSANAARASGALHDLGKYCRQFLDYISGKASSGGDHSLAGALAIIESATPRERGVARILAYVIAGHHAGLADHAELEDRYERSYNKPDNIWREEITTDFRALFPEFKFLSRDSNKAAAFQLAFWGRMVFSCLVDADYKDTERYYATEDGREIDRDWPDMRRDINPLVARFDAYMAKFASPAKLSELNDLRAHILSHVRTQAAQPQGIFTLTVPTGGGKTLASLGFALDHAKRHNLRRIVYAIPFTSIIEQNAAIFRDVLGDAYVLEHHSSIDQEKFDRNHPLEQLNKLKLAMADWAAPVVVTTNVQLFESLFANRPSKCRKLHNLANSIIILDEAQALPLGLLRPCMAALDELVKHYGVTVVLCTATQPAIDKEAFKEGTGLEIRAELAPDPAGLAQRLTRVRIEHGEELSDDQLIDALRGHDEALVIVNSRRHALALYRKALAEGLDGVVHLTTRQYAVHRREILAQVRKDLVDRKPCRLIATSLIEAGVDVDFPRVWRAEAGLDQVLQAAGRCNREGRRPVDDSIVTVFKAQGYKRPSQFEPLVAAFGRTAAKIDDLLSPEAIRLYFQELYWQQGAQLDSKAILQAFAMNERGARPAFDYRTVATNFCMIDSAQVLVIINDNPKVQAVLDRLQSSKVSPGKAARDLQPFVVQIQPRDLVALTTNDSVVHHRPDLWADQFAVLNRGELYTREAGLIWEDADLLYNSII